MSDSVVISKALRDVILAKAAVRLGGDEIEELRAAPEVMSLEGVEDVLRTHAKDVGGPDVPGYSVITDDQFPAILSDLRLLVANTELSLFQREQIAREFVDAFPDAIAPTKWAYEQVCAANEAKRVKLETLKRLVAPVQSSAVVSREAIPTWLIEELEGLQESANAGFRKGRDRTHTLSIMAEIFDRIDQLPQPVTPVQSGGVDLTLMVEQAFIDSKAPHDYPLIQTIARRLTHLTATQSAPSVGSVPSVEELEERYLGTGNQRPHWKDGVARIHALLTSRTEGKQE